MKQMWEKGIETGIHYKPIHQMTYFLTRKKIPTVDSISENLVSIPIHPNLKENDISKIINSVNDLS